MALDKEELAKLSPAERIKKLKEIEEDNKKTLEEAADLIKETEADIASSKMEDTIAVPEARQVDISELFEASDSALENAAATAGSDLTDTNVSYFVQDAYEGVKGALYSEEIDQAAIDAIGEKLDTVKYFSVGEEIEKMANQTQYLISKLRKGSDDATW